MKEADLSDREWEYVRKYRPESFTTRYGPVPENIPYHSKGGHKLRSDYHKDLERARRKGVYDLLRAKGQVWLNRRQMKRITKP